MKTILLKRRRPDDGRIETLARIRLAPAGQEAEVEALDPRLQSWVSQLLASGGVVDATGRRLAPSDGTRYLEALPGSFRGSRLWAEEVDTSDEENSG